MYHPNLLKSGTGHQGGRRGLLQGLESAFLDKYRLVWVGHRPTPVPGAHSQLLAGGPAQGQAWLARNAKRPETYHGLQQAGRPGRTDYAFCCKVARVLQQGPGTPVESTSPSSLQSFSGEGEGDGTLEEGHG